LLRSATVFVVKQVLFLLKPMAVGTIHLYAGGLSEADHPITGVHMVGSVADAVRASVARSGQRRVAVIPEGPYVVPVHRSVA
jgi:hypothetical protein